MNCGIVYRRIVELKGHNGSQLQGHKGGNALRSPPSKQKAGKRKLPYTFHEPPPVPRAIDEDEEVVGGDESDSQDEIHHFRRVYIKPRHGTIWSTVNKHPFLKIQAHGLDLRLERGQAGLLQFNTVAVGCATKPFGAGFYYFEVKILTKFAAGDDEDSGYVTKLDLLKPSRWY